MTTTTSSSNKGHFAALYRLLMRRNAGYFAMLSIIIFLFYPLQYAIEAFKKVDYVSMLVSGKSVEEMLAQNPMLGREFFGVGQNYTPVSVFFFIAIMLVVPMVLSLMLNSYMHSKKAADVFHALPIRRETLMLANAAVAGTMLGVPVVLSQLAIMGMFTFRFGFNSFILGQQLMDMLAILSCSMLIYAAATLACSFAGTLFDSFCFTGVLLCSLPVLLATYQLMAMSFLFGYSVESQVMSQLLLLSPFTMYPFRVGSLHSAYDFSGQLLTHREMDVTLAQFNIAVFVYVLVAAVLLFVALKVYARRPSERAETTETNGVLQLATKAIGTVLSSVFVGTLFYAMDMTSKWVYYVWAIIGGMLGFALIEVILSRGFKSLKKSIPFGAVSMAVPIVLSAVLMSGGLGYENKVPKVENVVTIQVVGIEDGNMIYVNAIDSRDKGSNYDWRGPVTVELTGESERALLLDFHQSVVDEKFTKLQGQGDTGDLRGVSSSVELTYHLKNGRKMVRQYNGFSTNSLQKLLPIVLSGEYQTQANPVLLMQPDAVTDVSVYNALGIELPSENEQRLRLVAQADRLLEAMRADVQLQTADTMLNPTAKPIAYLRMYAEPSKAKKVGLFVRQIDSFAVSTDTPNTMRVLGELGMTDKMSTPDLSTCVGVQVEVVGLDPNNWIYRMGSLTRDYSSGNGYSYEELLRIQKDRAEGLSMRGEPVLCEDLEMIKAMTEQVVPSWDRTKPYVMVWYYLKDATGTTEWSDHAVMVPFERLPADVQATLSKAPYVEDDSDGNVLSQETTAELTY